MSGVMTIVNEQFGRILLGLSVLATIILWSQNGSLNLPQITDSDKQRQVMVELDKAGLPTASPEKFFVSGNGASFAGGERFIFVAEKKIIPFQPVELDVPPATVGAPAQLLPDPGPTLEGTAKLPRFGEELPPVVLGAKDNSKDPKKDK